MSLTPTIIVPCSGSGAAMKQDEAAAGTPPVGGHRLGVHAGPASVSSRAASLGGVACPEAAGAAASAASAATAAPVTTRDQARMPPLSPTRAAKYRIPRG